MNNNKEMNKTVSHIQTVQTESNQNRPNITIIEIQPRSIPKTLILLLVLLVLQISISSTVGVLQIAQGYIGFDNKIPMTIDISQCSNPVVLNKFYGNQIVILCLGLVGSTGAFALTLILILVIVNSIIKSRKLGTDKNIPRYIDINNLYYVMTSCTRKTIFLIQSIVILFNLVVFAYYFSYYLNSQVDCIWTNYNSTQITVIWVLSGSVFICEWMVWLSIFTLNMKNNHPFAWRYENKQEYEYLLQTQINKTLADDAMVNKTIPPVSPVTPPTPPKPILKTYHAPEVTLFPSRVLDYNLSPSKHVGQPQISQLAHSKAQTFSYINNINNQSYNPQGSRADTNQNPIFKEKKDFYSSPYKRIENSAYYEINKINVDDNRLEQKPIHHNQVMLEMTQQRQGERKQDFRGSRFKNQYKMPSNITPEEEQYLRSISRARAEDTKHTPIRKIFPDQESEGRHTKLHSTYFRDETSMLNKKNNESDDRKKRKGVLSEYIAGKYTNN